MILHKSSSSLLFLLLTARGFSNNNNHVHGIRWNNGSPLTPLRLPIVVRRDGTPNARSSATISSTISSAIGTSSSSGGSGQPGSSSVKMKNAVDLETKDDAESWVNVDERDDSSVTTSESPSVTEILLRSGNSTNSKTEPTKNLEGKKRLLGRKRKKKEPDTSAKAIAKKLKNRNRTNISRKVWHATFGLFFASLNHVVPRHRFVPGMVVLTTATLIMELLRYRKGFSWMNDALHFVLGSSLRKHEMEGKFTGSFYYFLGVTTTAWCFPKTAATLGMCQLALADPSASYFGRQTRHVYWSRIENGLGGFGRNKGILGFIGGALFCFPFNYRVLSVAKFGTAGIPGGRNYLLLASVALGFAGAFADLAVPTPAVTMPEKICGVRVPPFHIDDNFVVPLFSAYACTKIFSTLGWPQDLQLAEYLIA